MYVDIFSSKSLAKYFSKKGSGLIHFYLISSSIAAA